MACLWHQVDPKDKQYTRTILIQVLFNEVPGDQSVTVYITGTQSWLQGNIDAKQVMAGKSLQMT